MKNMNELQRKIEHLRSELDKALSQEENFESCYQKSTLLDKLIEEYIETAEYVKK